MLRVRPWRPMRSDPDAAAAVDRKFGFRWFVPELLKHKKIWREVLAGFARPAAHVPGRAALHPGHHRQGGGPSHAKHAHRARHWHGGVHRLHRLPELGAAVPVLHTGNRVDAVLGSHVFEHLFRLPMLYFQHRPTGVIAARLQGIETIREFVAPPPSVDADLPFLFIFVAVMFFYSVKLTCIVLAILAVIVITSLLVAPLFQRRLNEQFLRGAANQAFVTEYVSGLETVKSLQLESQLNHRYRDMLAAFLKASFGTRQLANTYGTVANGPGTAHVTLLILAFGAWIVMTSLEFHGRYARGVPDVFVETVAADAAAGGVVAAVPAGAAVGSSLGDIMNVPTEPYGSRGRERRRRRRHPDRRVVVPLGGTAAAAVRRFLAEDGLGPARCC